MALPIKTNGIYYINDGNKHYNVSFYANGLCNYYELYWGLFFIKNDSLMIQYFYVDQESFYKRIVIELFGTIINDTSISIYKEKCSRCKNVYFGYENKTAIVYDEPRVYTFQEQIKLDSANAWFLNKKWYKKNLRRSATNCTEGDKRF